MERGREGEGEETWEPNRREREKTVFAAHSRIVPHARLRRISTPQILL